jgi:LCP family protein required for cell wall assembly
MKNKKLTYLLIIDVIVALFGLVFVMVAMWNKPLGPSLAHPIDPNQPNALPAEGATSNGEANTSLQPTPTEASLLSQISSLLSPKKEEVKTLCGGPPIMYILLLGSDQRGTDYSYGLTDAIRLVRVDFVTPSVTMLDFPRDLWVEIPGISDHYDITHAKLNQAYFFGSPAMGYYDGLDGGPGLAAQTLQLNFSAHVDHYLVMNMQSFENMVDTIGGVDIYLSSVVDMNEGQDGANPDKVFAAGYHHLDGAQALAFARDRIPTIFQRARYQTMILQALEKKLLTPAMIPSWPQVIADFRNAVQTDLSPNELSQLVCLAKAINSENITTVAFPDSMFASAHTYDPYRQVYTFTLDADFSQMRTYVSDFMNGVWP